MMIDTTEQVARWLRARYDDAARADPRRAETWQEDARDLLAELSDEFPAIAVAVSRPDAADANLALREGITEEEMERAAAWGPLTQPKFTPGSPAWSTERTEL